MISADGNLILILNRENGSKVKLILPNNTARTSNGKIEAAGGLILEPLAFWN